MQISPTESPTRSSSEAETGRADDAGRPPADDRWEWIEHVVPISFLRVLWNGLFPSRFRALVLDGLDGSPPPGYARPLTFCVGCWLLFAASVQAFPWASHEVGLGSVLAALPPTDRRAVTQALGIDTIVTVADSGAVTIGAGGHRSLARIHLLTHRRFGPPTASDIAQFLETRGDRDLAIRVRGYVARESERPTPFNQTALVFFVVFGLVPGWWVSHKLLASSRRTVRETRAVHMYNDSWFVVFVLIPLSIATYAGVAFASLIPQRVLLLFAIAGLVTWLARTPMLFRATHGAPRGRVIVAHIAGLTVSVVMAVVFAAITSILKVLVTQSGF